MYKILCSLFDMIILLLTGIDIYESMCNAAKVSVFNWDRDMVIRFNIHCVSSVDKNVF